MCFYIWKTVLALVLVVMGKLYWLLIMTFAVSLIPVWVESGRGSPPLSGLEGAWSQLMGEMTLRAEGFPGAPASTELHP